MAGRIKHMERSHRSHNKNYGMFNQFHRNAYKVSYYKNERKTVGQRLSQLLRGMMPKTTQEGKPVKAGGQ